MNSDAEKSAARKAAKVAKVNAVVPSDQTAAAADALASAVFGRLDDGAEGPEESSGAVAIEDGVGLGVDIVEIARMARILQRTESFAARVFTEDERAYCQGMAQPAVHYATRFAGKEAVLKALGTGFSCGIAPADVEIARNAKGRPIVRLHRRAREVAKQLGVLEIPLSLSFTHTDAVACAMAITDDSVRAAEERVDPMEELARQFKEARTMLDEMPAAGVKQAVGAAAGVEAVESADGEGDVR